MNLKVLVVAPQPFFTERGTPIATRRLIDTLARLGHSVDLLTYPLGRDVSVAADRVYRSAGVPGIRHVPVGASWRKLLLDLPLTAAFARRARPGAYDVVHGIEEAIFPALALRKWHRAKVVYDMDSRLSTQLLDQYGALRPFAGVLRRTERWALRRSDLVLAVCDDLSAHAARHVDSPTRIHVLRDVPVEPDPSSRGIDDIGGEWPDGTKIALYVGNLAGYQGIDLLLEAAKRLDADSGIGIVVIGGTPANVDAYRRRVVNLELEDRIRFLGARPVGDLAAYLEQADMLLSPRIKGGNTPLKIYSYMASGRPILATRLDTHTQVLDDETAVLFAPDARSLCAALRELAADPERRQQLGEAARRRVEAAHSKEAYVDGLRAAYSTLEPDAAS